MPTMVHVALVLYETKEGGKFDLDYYLKTHMPLVQKNWGSMGLSKWEVVNYKEGLGGAAPDFTISATLFWESKDAMDKALKDESAKEVFGDVPNFTNIQPKFISGASVGTS